MVVVVNQVKCFLQPGLHFSHPLEEEEVEVEEEEEAAAEAVVEGTLWMYQIDQSW